MPNPSPELLKQVEAEQKEILNAPPIIYGPTIPTCHFCGRIITGEPKFVERHTDERSKITHERFMGPCCG